MVRASCHACRSSSPGRLALVQPDSRPRHRAGEVFRGFLMLGLTSFGGPVAHLAYFREAFVLRRRWLTEQDYADLVALCQFLPGPASSQVGMAIGLRRAGYLGMAAAWVAFTLPSALLMLGFALGADALDVTDDAGWLRGLKAAAVAVVAHAVLGMARTLAVGPRRATIAIAATVAMLLVPAAGSQVAVIIGGGLLGVFWLTSPAAPEGHDEDTVPVGRRAALAAFTVFVGLLASLPVLAVLVDDPTLGLVDSFYRAGSLVFGGGHVVLPLLESETVGAGLVDEGAFLAGYGAAQAVPGPLFTFSAYLGAVMPVPGGAVGALVALLAIFAPSALLVVAGLPFWERLRGSSRARRALGGAGAAVVGLLAAALVDPVLTEGVTGIGSAVVAAMAFGALAVGKAPAWGVVIVASGVGFVVL